MLFLFLNNLLFLHRMRTRVREKRHLGHKIQGDTHSQGHASPNPAPNCEDPPTIHQPHEHLRGPGTESSLCLPLVHQHSPDERSEIYDPPCKGSASHLFLQIGDFQLFFLSHGTPKLITKNLLHTQNCIIFFADLTKNRYNFD